MNIEDNIFKRSHVDFSKLSTYGFIKENDYYIYTKNFMNDNFKAVIIIDKFGQISGKTYDLETLDEYTNIRLDIAGDFVSQVREIYQAILNDIKNNCFITDYFIYEQTNRIAKYITDNYGDKPEFLWPKYDNYGVFRNNKNHKWYGIIMNIDKSKITKGHGEVEIIDIKLPEDTINNLLTKDGYYMAYHMNKHNWIDDTLSDEEIIKYLNISYNLINK